MSKKRQPKLEPVEIPAESYIVKNWFERKPPDSIIKEIQNHVKETGLPHTWRGHTHTKPARTATPKYIGEFDLPERLVKSGQLAPCPCCTVTFPKYGRGGKIAWFRKEGVIRLIGPRCFASLNREGHEKAEREFRVAQQRKRDTAFLLSNLPHISDAIRTMEKALSVAKAIKLFHTELHKKLIIMNLPLWNYVRNGELKVFVQSQEFRRNSDSSMRVTDVDEERVYASLPGYKMLDPNLPSFASPLETALRNLRPFDHGRHWKSELAAMSDEEKLQAAKIISRSVQNGKTAIENIRDVRRFVERVAISTLRNWGLHEGCPIPRNYIHKTSSISIGRSEYGALDINLPEGITSHIPEIEFWTADLSNK